jgi:ATP/maltotriose-dependent transcriptional regulator MalT
MRSRPPIAERCSLDDYHLITDPEIHQSVTLLVEHLPAELHLAVTARSEPSLPLARWRGRGELIELDAARLRFSPEEAEVFLNDLLGLGLDRAEVATLQERTEGWPAGLYLAALSVRGRTNRQRFITQFAGTDRYVVDYLGEEVLRGQPEDVRAFLMR